MNFLQKYINENGILIFIAALYFSVIPGSFILHAQSTSVLSVPPSIIYTSSSSNSSSQQTSLNTETVSIDVAGERITSILQSAGINLGFISSQNISNLNQQLPISIQQPIQELPVNTFPQRKTLQQLISAPQNAAIKDTLKWEKYKIDAPLQYASFSDFYFTKADGFIDFTKYRDTSLIESPIQQKLKDGVVHLPISPLPGEIGNSYIVGHSSNYLNVISSYNSIFAPLLNSVSVGEEFTLFDHRGRELRFKVFETKVVSSNDPQEAYTHSPYKRLVTLQASILELVNGSYSPTKRYLVKAELIEP